MIGKRVKIIKGGDPIPQDLVGATGTIKRSNPMGLVVVLDKALHLDGVSTVFVHPDEIEVID